MNMFAKIDVKPPSVGDPAPDALLQAVDGSETPLSRYWARQPVVLVFLRHLGCVFCREQVARLKADYAGFRVAGAEVICVAQGNAHVGKAFTILLDLPFPILMCGDDVGLFRRYGLVRGTFWQLFGLPSILGGIRAVLAGNKQGRLAGDGFQMPGVFIVDQGGIVRYVHRHKNAADNPQNRELLAALETLR
jgi:peroxiredoxin